MGGPWKARGFDPLAWRRPMAHAAVETAGDRHTTRLVIVYVAAVLASGMVLLLLVGRVP